MIPSSNQVYQSVGSTTPLHSDILSNFSSSSDNLLRYGHGLYVFGQTPEQLRHTRCHPSISTSPIVRNIRSMIEKSIRTLQLVQVHNHFFRCPVNIFTVFCHFVCVGLHNRNHIHVINPQTCLPRISFFQPILFLLVWHLQELPIENQHKAIPDTSISYLLSRGTFPVASCQTYSNQHDS